NKNSKLTENAKNLNLSHTDSHLSQPKPEKLRIFTIHPFVKYSFGVTKVPHLISIPESKLKDKDKIIKKIISPCAIKEVKNIKNKNNDEISNLNNINNIDNTPNNEVKENYISNNINNTEANHISDN